jgi:peptidoglycan-associated lipoprotein
MKRRLYLIAMVSTLLISGCAQKEVSNMDVTDKTPTTTSSSQHAINSSINRNNGTLNGYENVDPYAQNIDTYTQDESYDALQNRLQNIYFDVDQYIITPDKLPTIISNAKILNKAIQNGSKVKIEGNCDATGSDEYNYALGLRRAKAAKEALVSQGINPSKIVIVSLGESSPLCTTDYSSACFAKNRRVEFKIIQ